jgi:putative membrane protein
MRTVRSFEIIALALPLSLAACGKGNDLESRSAHTVRTEPDYAPPAHGGQQDAMTPASRVAESQGSMQGTQTPAEQSPANQGAAPENTLPAPLDDAQIAALTDAANTAEVDAAKHALTHAKNPRVRKFAQQMIDHHGKAKQDQAKLVSKLGLAPAESPKLRDFRTSAADTERTLKAAPDDMFDKVYIDIQVADHQLVLDLLDRDFIPHAQNPEFKKSLQDFRPKVEQHLNQALEIQKMLMSAPAPKSGSKSGAGSSGNPAPSTGSREQTGTPSGPTGTGSSGTGTGMK